MQKGSVISLKLLFGGFLLVLGIFYFWFAYLSLCHCRTTVTLQAGSGRASSLLWASARAGVGSTFCVPGSDK